MEQEELNPGTTGIKQERNPDGTFKEGVSGNLNGRPRGSLAFATALKIEAEKQAGIITLEDGTTKKVSALEIITRKLVEMGKQGDMQAIKEIADRMDGKPKQAVDHTSDGKALVGNTIVFKEFNHEADSK